MRRLSLLSGAAGLYYLTYAATSPCHLTAIKTVLTELGIALTPRDGGLFGGGMRATLEFAKTPIRQYDWLNSFAPIGPYATVYTVYTHFVKSHKKTAQQQQQQATARRGGVLGTA